MSTIANGCPETDGRAFYEARTLLNLLSGQQLHFTSNCTTGNNYNGRLEGIASFSAPRFNLHPNPTNGIVTIELPNRGRVIGVVIINCLGEQVNAFDLTEVDKADIDLNSLSKGIYFVKVTIDNENFGIQKIIVEH